MQRIGIIVGKDSHRSDMQFTQALNDTHRDFTSVSNQYFIYLFAVHSVIMIPQRYKKKDNL
jgi:hypothetical protein